MIFPRALIDELVDHAREQEPNECCGMVGSRNGRAVKAYRAVNAEASPLRYSIGPADQYRIVTQIDSEGLDLGAIYHSHTRSPSYPSQTDINLAFYPDSLYLIVSLENSDEPDVRAFKIRDERVEEVALEVEG